MCEYTISHLECGHKSDDKANTRGCPKYLQNGVACSPENIFTRQYVTLRKVDETGICDKCLYEECDDTEATVLQREEERVRKISLAEAKEREEAIREHELKAMQESQKEFERRDREQLEEARQLSLAETRSREEHLEARARKLSLESKHNYDNMVKQNEESDFECAKRMSLEAAERARQEEEDLRLAIQNSMAYDFEQGPFPNDEASKLKTATPTARPVSALPSQIPVPVVPTRPVRSNVVPSPPSPPRAEVKTTPTAQRAPSPVPSPPSPPPAAIKAIPIAQRAPSPIPSPPSPPPVAIRTIPTAQRAPSPIPSPPSPPPVAIRTIPTAQRAPSPIPSPPSPPPAAIKTTPTLQRLPSLPPPTKDFSCPPMTEHPIGHYTIGTRRQPILPQQPQEPEAPTIPTTTHVRREPAPVARLGGQIAPDVSSQRGVFEQIQVGGDRPNLRSSGGSRRSLPPPVESMMDPKLEAALARQRMWEEEEEEEDAASKPSSSVTDSPVRLNSPVTFAANATYPAHSRTDSAQPAWSSEDTESSVKPSVIRVDSDAMTRGDLDRESPAAKRMSLHDFDGMRKKGWGDRTA